MHITCETEIDSATAERFLAVHRAAFAPVAFRAAGRQSLTDEEFNAEMVDARVLKFVGWGSGEPVALALVATDLEAVPWISVDYFRNRFPDHFETGRIFYFGALLVHPDHQGGPAVGALLEELVRFTASHHAIAAFDACEWNVEVLGVPAIVAEVASSLAHVDLLEIDTQRYYAYVTAGLREPAVDLVATEAEELRALDDAPNEAPTVSDQRASMGSQT